jgi:hypothetical protein
LKTALRGTFRDEPIRGIANVVPFVSIFADLRLRSDRPGGGGPNKALCSAHVVSAINWRTGMGPSIITIIVSIILGLGVASAAASP